MAEVIQGSKSSLYIKDPVPGIENSADTFTHQSIQNLWDSRGASDVLIHAVRMSSAIASVIAAGSVKRLINVVAHGAKKGDSIRMNNGNADGEEVAIISIIDANNFIIAKEVNAAIGDELFILKPVTPTYNKDGSLNVSNGPTQFIKDALVQQVTEDTVVPANNEPLPSKLFFQKDGVTYPVNKDTAIPANTAAIPVEIVGTSGQVVTINAGDINVQLSHLGANFDSTRIGDGTNLMGVNASLEALVHDADVLTALGDVNAELNTQTTALGDINTELDTQTTALGDINTELNTQTTALGSLLTELQLKADLTETQPVSVASLPLPTGASTEAKQDTQITALSDINAELDAQTTALGLLGTEVTLAAMSAKLPATLGSKSDAASLAVTNSTEDKLAIGSLTETAPATDIASSGLNGRLQRIAQNISAMILQLPATLGIKTAALSLSVAPASDAVFEVKASPVTANFAENLTLTTVATVSAPANAIGVLIQASDANAANIRVKQGGGTATTTSGIQFQPGRSEEFKCGTDLSICSESGTNAISFQWFLQA